MVIRDEKGDIVATIDGKTWKLYKEGYDYNNDDKGFEIVTPDKKVLFQIFLESEIVHIRGLIMTDKKTGFYIHECDYGSAWNPVNPAKFNFEIPKTVKRLFKYPREKYFGVRN